MLSRSVDSLREQWVKFLASRILSPWVAVASSASIRTAIWWRLEQFG